MSREQNKATQYIQQLDDARCDGNWDAVPELVRKIKKHAPQRTCLATTAVSEHAVYLASRPSRPQTGSPANARSSAATPTQTSGLARQLPLLLEAIEKEGTYAEDIYQAKVCLGWIHWQLGDLAMAASSLPSGIEEEFAQLDGANLETAHWTKVCAIKASYVKGLSQQRSGEVAKALETYESSLPVLASQSSGLKYEKELRFWSELFLTSFCMVSSHAIKSSISSILETETLSAFRTWSRFWELQSPAPVGGRSMHAGVSRRQVWREYYITLSDLLQRDLPFPTTSLATAYTDVSTRLQQRAELKKVEARYETLLLGEVQFPKAEEPSEEVESFANLVMQNWRVLCGRSWNEHDLGEGGAEAVTRGVLDIIYRAATKTFHSTAILRHLFTLHLAIAEFELAFKAFDTYIDIVKKGKARVEKTGEAEHSLDDDEVVLETACECIRALCRYGSMREAEKAKDIGQYFEAWIEKHYPLKSNNLNSQPAVDFSGAAVRIAPTTFALVWRCIGIAHAQWARSTYDAASRSDVQARAIECFRKSLSPQYESSKNVETLFAFGTLLAERGEIASAIEAVKYGLLSFPTHSSSSVPHSMKFMKERTLIPLWHLMSLLLSARQQFLTAARSCEGAFEQFQDPKNLFGEPDLGGLYRSTHLNDKVISPGHGVIDDMDDFEKENILQVKMTQLALIEVMEAPDVAVNASDELLSLYTRLFGESQMIITASTPIITALPQSSAGTIRSIKGSIFGRHGRSVRKPNTNGTPSEKTVSDSRPQTMASTRAPTIQVTSENGVAAKKQPFKRDGSIEYHEKLQRQPESISKKPGYGISQTMSDDASQTRVTNTGNVSNQIVEEDDQFSTPPIHKTSNDKWLNSEELVLTPSGALSTSDPFDTAAQGKQMSKASFHSFSMTPVTQFSRSQQIQRRAAILIRVWLLVSGFYRRACMYDDAKGAIEEAQKVTKMVEKNPSSDVNSTSSDHGAGWQGNKSTEELLSDIETERGYLALAEDAPYIALTHFESALTRFKNHPAATVGLANILLDIYTEDLPPPPFVPSLDLPPPMNTPSSSSLNSTVRSTPLSIQPPAFRHESSLPMMLHGPLGLPATKETVTPATNLQDASSILSSQSSGLQPNYKESSSALLDRLAARDRAYGLLTNLTKLGTGWNYSEAWYALARAYEEGGQSDKASEVLWWCVELEEGRAIRDWSVVGSGGYVLM